jgi:hypothetical protein
MTRILTELITRNIDNERWVQLMTPFIVYLDTVQSKIIIPAGFVQDFESIPIVRGRNKRGGTVHDYLSRIDSDPVVTQREAAAAYFEINEYCDAIDHTRNIPIQIADWARRWAKWSVVAVWPGFFHKHLVAATPKEIAGLDCDPYVTQEKLEALIQKQEDITEGIKDAPIPETPALVAASEKVTEDLKVAKVEAAADLKEAKDQVP